MRVKNHKNLDEQKKSPSNKQFNRATETRSIQKQYREPVKWNRGASNEIKNRSLPAYRNWKETKLNLQLNWRVRIYSRWNVETLTQQSISRCCSVLAWRLWQAQPYSLCWLLFVYISPYLFILWEDDGGINYNTLFWIAYNCKLL